jgi:cytochrome c peroxidase
MPTLACSAALWCALLVVACAPDVPDPHRVELAKLSGLGPPPADTSNAVSTSTRAAALGKVWYFDPHFAGRSTGLDMLLRPLVTAPRAPVGAPLALACNTCHDVARGGGDSSPEAQGSPVSLGAGAYDVNGQQTFNAAYYDLLYWNGRNDSLWSQIVAVVESHVSVGSSRLRVAWRIADRYRADYAALFPEHPLPPELDDVAAQKARLASDGTCVLVDGQCPTDTCHTTYGPCLPRFPLEGRPGVVRPGEAACTWGSSDAVRQPHGDAWDCMRPEDQRVITRVFVNFAKAIAAYERTLVSADSDFDRWVASGFSPGIISPQAERGAQLFVGKAACAQCHSGPLLSDQAFHNIGVPQEGPYLPQTSDCPAGGWCDCASDDRLAPTNCLAIGARDGLRKLQANRFRRDSAWSDDAECRDQSSAHADPDHAALHPQTCGGRVRYYSLPLTNTLRGAWRTPSLRDVALTAPYMHNGMYRTLREVVEHYDDVPSVAPGAELSGTRSAQLVPLHLHLDEVEALVAFLETLTGRPDPSVIAPPVVPPRSDF